MGAAVSLLIIAAGVRFHVLVIGVGKLAVVRGLFLLSLRFANRL